MQVEPQTPLPLVYQINDHTDASRDSYYVRAVVRDSLTGATVQTKNLTSAGSGRYAAQFNPPVDGTGLGRQIDVTTTVYSDSGYTTKHPNYSEVLERWYVKSAPSGHYGGAGGEEVDYERVDRIFRQVIKELQAANKPPAPEPVDLQPLATAVQTVLEAVQGIKIPEAKTPQPVDLSPILKAITGLQAATTSAIRAIPEADLDPVIEAIQTVAESIGRVHDLTAEHKTELVTTLKAVRDLYGQNQARRDQVEAAIRGLIQEPEPEGQVIARPHPVRSEPSPYRHLFQ